MKRQQVHYTYRLADTLTAMTNGGVLLVATKKSGRSNVMTIGWGAVGVIWRRPIFLVMVRPSRYTYEFMEEAGEFTVNIPTAELREWVTFCGTHSGRDVDKFAAGKVSVSPAQLVHGVTIDACPIVYECRVVHKNDVIPANLEPNIAAASYPSGDFHRLYYGEILGVFAAEEA